MSQATHNPAVFNQSGNEPFESVLEKSLSRRALMRGSFSIVAASMLGGAGIVASGGIDKPVPATGSDGVTGNGGGVTLPAVAPRNPNVIELKFESIAGSRTDAVAVSPGYRAQVLAPWGTPLNARANAWKDDGTNTAADQANAVGMHHDGIWFFPITGSNTAGLLAINHEFIDQNTLHPSGPTKVNDKRTVAEEIRKEINAHGVTVVRVTRDAAGLWSVVANDPLNRRYTGATEMDIAGPLAGSAKLITPYSADGRVARGTLNNCGNGHTPWGTYLTCEEHWPEYFVNLGEKTPDQLRIGVGAASTRYGWHEIAGDPGESNAEFTRFDVTPTGAGATDDYRNEMNGHGYIVEIDPYSANARAVKRTALGRFRHEGCIPGNPVAGYPIVFYSGHDARGEYIYKFVSDIPWNAADANPADRIATGSKYMDAGTLNVARFNADGTGDWLPLTVANPALSAFADLPDIILNTVAAADALGATPMDRPEWGAVDPTTGSVYFTLTNNSRRGTAGSISPSERNSRSAPDAANPRAENKNGHIIRWDETADPAKFNWEVFVFGSNAAANADTNRSGLVEMNQFASPDGLVFDARGILWIQTDNGAQEVANYTNDQMLAIVPTALADRAGKYVPVSTENQTELRRFFVGPNGCEVTGLAFTQDNSTFFANIQHPGNWPSTDDAAFATPAGTTVRPRAATVAISKIDGGAIGV